MAHHTISDWAFMTVFWMYLIKIEMGTLRVERSCLFWTPTVHMSPRAYTKKLFVREDHTCPFV